MLSTEALRVSFWSFLEFFTRFLFKIYLLVLLPPSTILVLPKCSSSACPSLLHLGLFRVHAGKSTWTVQNFPRPPSPAWCFVVSSYFSFLGLHSSSAARCRRLPLCCFPSSLHACCVRRSSCFHTQPVLLEVPFFCVHVSSEPYLDLICLEIFRGGCSCLHFKNVGT